MDLEGAPESPTTLTIPPQRVVVIDLDMELGTMIWFLVKLAIAAIPAAGVVWVIVFLAMTAIRSMAA